MLTIGARGSWPSDAPQLFSPKFTGEGNDIWLSRKRIAQNSVLFAGELRFRLASACRGTCVAGASILSFDAKAPRVLST